MAAFQRIIIPIGYEFNPELVVVSIPVGSGNLSPETFGYLTHWLSALANGKLILFMRGDCNTIGTCIKALLGDPLPMLKGRLDKTINNLKTIQNVVSVQQKHWKSLKFNKILPVINEI